MDSGITIGDLKARLRAINDAMLSRATSGGVVSYGTAGQSFSFASMNDLESLYQSTLREIAKMSDEGISFVSDFSGGTVDDQRSDEFFERG